jgi:tetratricopeptide (TPR) repeat protein
MRDKRSFLAAAFLAAAFYLRGASLESVQADMQFNLALNYYKSGKLDDSAETLKKALKLAPEHPQANLLLGLIRNQQGNFKEAIEPLKLASKKLSDNFDVFNNLGVAAFQAKELSESEEAFKKALALQPGMEDVQINLGILEMQQKKWKEAEEAFAAATKAKEDDSKAWLGLAEAAEKNGDKDAEMAALAKVLSLKPDDREVRLNLAQKLYRGEQNDKALEILAPLKDMKDSEAEFLFGCILYRKASFDESRRHFEEALKARPDYPEARFNLAITLYDQNRFSEALSQFDEVLKKHPDDQQAKSNLEITRKAGVRSYLKAGSQDFLQGGYLSALEKWNSALELEKDNKVIKDLIETAQAQLKLQAAELAGKGALAMQADKIEDALEFWSQALERDPANADALQGMNKVKVQAQKLTELYARNFQKAMDEEDLFHAGEAAKKVLALNKSAGEPLMKQWTEAVEKRSTELAGQAESAAQKGMLLEAVEKLDEAKRLKKDDAALSQKLDEAKVALRTELEKAQAAAKQFEEAKDNTRAAKEYRRILALDPANHQAQEALKRFAKNAESAKAKALNPAELDEWYYQGVYAYAAGDTAKAMGFWKKVLEADPNHPLAQEAVKRANKRLKALSNVN